MLWYVRTIIVALLHVTTILYKLLCWTYHTSLIIYSIWKIFTWHWMTYTLPRLHCVFLIRVRITLKECNLIVVLRNIDFCKNILNILENNCFKLSFIPKIKMVLNINIQRQLLTNYWNDCISQRFAAFNANTGRNIKKKVLR